jgi:hypothetical protein
MGKDHKQKQAYKYLHGLCEIVSVNIRKGWDRKNYDKGYFRSLRRNKRAKDIETLMKQEING